MVGTIWFLILVPVCLYLVSTYIKPLNGVRNLRALITGILGLAFAMLLLHATYAIAFASLPHPNVAFRTVRATVGGAFATMALSMGFRQAPKIMLIIAGILFAASSLIVTLGLHKPGRSAMLHPRPSSLNVYSLEAGPVGLAIPAIVLMWQSRRNNGKSGGPDCGPQSPDGTDEDSLGA